MKNTWKSTEAVYEATSHFRSDRGMHNTTICCYYPVAVINTSVCKSFMTPATNEARECAALTMNDLFGSVGEYSFFGGGVANENSCWRLFYSRSHHICLLAAHKNCFQNKDTQATSIQQQQHWGDSHPSLSNTETTGHTFRSAQIYVQNSPPMSKPINGGKTTVFAYPIATSTLRY